MKEKTTMIRSAAQLRLEVLAAKALRKTGGDGTAARAFVDLVRPDPVMRQALAERLAAVSRRDPDPPPVDGHGEARPTRAQALRAAATLQVEQANMLAIAVGKEELRRLRAGEGPWILDREAFAAIIAGG